MIINHFTDNDLYKFTTMYAIQKLYPQAMVKYKFFNRDNTPFPEGFAEALGNEVQSMANLALTKAEEKFISEKCYYFDPVFIDFLKGYRYNPSEVAISQTNGKLDLTIEGFWFRTVLWEVPLMAIISELYFKMTGAKPAEIESKAEFKAKELANMGVLFSDFGTRRRFSFNVHNKVVKTLQNNASGHLTGTSNVFMAMSYGLTPIGTHPHEWFMFHGAHFGYRMANLQALKAWSKVYEGNLGIALTDTYTTDAFFNGFDLLHAKLFDGLRWDSGDPIEFTNKALANYKRHRIDPKSKTIVYSDSLNLEKVKEISKFAAGKINDVYGIGTYFTNDVGAKPLNIVIKLTQVKTKDEATYHPAIKLSDASGKHTGDKAEIELCKQTLDIK